MDQQPVKNLLEGQASFENISIEQDHHKYPKSKSKKNQLAEYSKAVGNISIFRDLNHSNIIRDNKKVKWINQFADNIRVQTIESDLQSLVVEVYYGNYKMRITTLITCFDDEEIKDEIFAQGAFGSIYRAQMDGRQYAIKGINIYIDEGKMNLNHIYKEYFLCSIASLLEVGPKMQTIMGYDVVTLKGKACFAMQMCRVLQIQQNCQKIYNQMLKNLGIIHSIGFVHLDIKTDNIAFSKTYQKYVFLDFGLSKIIKEPLGMKTLTRFIGTIGFCSKQMKKAYWLGDTTFIDLYYNDFVSLKSTNRVLLQRKQYLKNANILYQYNLQGKNMSYPNYLTIVLKLSRLKFFIYSQNVESIQDMVKNNLYLSKTFYIILSDQFLKYVLKQSKKIKVLIAQLKEILIKFSLVISTFDERFSNFFSSKMRPLLTPHVLTLEYALQLQNQKFRSNLAHIDFIQRLFLVFNPVTHIFPYQKSQEMQRQINNVRMKIINKIYLNLNIEEKGEALFYQKIRSVLIFFYKQLRVLKRRDILISIRLLFLMTKDYSFVIQLDQQICSCTEDQNLRILSALQFTLFQAKINHIKVQKLKIFKSYLGKLKPLDSNQNFLLSFAYKILIVDNYLAHRLSFRLQLLNEIENMQKSLARYTNQLRNIQTLFCQLGKITKTPSEQETLLQYAYCTFYTSVPKIQHEQILQFFSVSPLKVSYSSENKKSSAKAFKIQIEKFATSMKKCNKYSINIFTRNDQIFFYNDHQISLHLMKTFVEHIHYFHSFSDQQTFNCWFQILWLLKIVDGNRRISLKSEQNNDAIIRMLDIIESGYLYIKSKTQRYQVQNWYILFDKTLECLLLLYRAELKQLLKILKQIKIIIEFSCKSLHMMIVVISLLCRVSENMNSTDDASEKLTEQSQKMLVEIFEHYYKNQLIEIFYVSDLFFKAIKIYIKKDMPRKVFESIRWMIQRINQPQVSIFAKQMLIILKQSIIAFCSSLNFYQWIMYLDEFNSQPLESLYPEEVYFQFAFLYNIIKSLGVFKNQTLQQTAIKNNLASIPSVKNKIMRIVKGIKKNSSIFSKDMELGFFQCFRLNFEIKTKRKKDICLRKEHQYNLLKLKTLKIQSKGHFIDMINQKLNKLCNNQKYIISRWDSASIR